MSESQEEKTKEFESHHTLVRATITIDYLIPSYICDLDRVTKEWFEKFPMGYRHASRDGSIIKGSQKIQSYKVMTWDEYKKERER